MEDERWTVKDKLEQLRGVTSLFNSTTENIKGKISAQRKKQSKDIRNLATQNKKYRQQYEEAIHDDKKNLLPVLNTHPTMQMAMKNLNHQQIEEALKQSIFSKHKELDRLRYKRKNLEDELLKKKLEYVRLQNKIEETPENYLWEQEIANQLQSVSVKLNTARANRDVYEKALNILQKDAIRFDQVIKELEKDVEQQSESIVRAVEMGQNMKEELANLQLEYKVTERAVRANMKQRNRALRDLRSDIDTLRQQSQALQRESHVGLQANQSRANLDADSADINVQALLDLQLKGEISSLQTMLREIKDAAKVQRVQEVCPRMEAQKKQKVWLQRQIEQNQFQLARLLELYNQLDIMLEVTMYHTMTEEAIQLREEKLQLTKEIEEERKNLLDTQAELKNVGDKIVKIRTALLTFKIMIDSVMPSTDDTITVQSFSSERDYEGSSTLGGLYQPKTDALTLMKQVISRVKLLIDKVVTKVGVKFIPTALVDVETSLQLGFEDEADNIVSDMLNDLEDMDDPSVPTRKDIKAESKRLVDMFDDPRAMFDNDDGPKYKRHKCF